MGTVDGKGRTLFPDFGHFRGIEHGALALGVALSLCATAHAGDGDVDTTFGLGGTALHGAALVDLDHDFASRTLALPDGRVLLAGAQHGPVGDGFGLLQLDAAGLPDLAFGPLFGGRALHTLDGATQPRALARRANGAVLALFADKLVTFSAEGALLETRSALELAGTPGLVPDLRALAQRSDGRLVVAGSAATASTVEFVAIALDAAGAPDMAFGAGGVARVPVAPTAVLSDVAPAPDGGVVLAGSVENAAPALRDMLVLRIGPDGAIDTAFGDGGRTVVALDRCGAGAQATGENADEATLVRTTGGGTIVLVGRAGSLPCRDVALDDAIAIVRLRPCGTLDTQFGTNGVATLAGGEAGGSEPTAALLQPDGSTIVGGIQRGRGLFASSYGFVARVDTSGALDTTFGDDAPVAGVHLLAAGTGAENQVGDLAFSAGRIVVAGAAAGVLTHDYAAQRLENAQHMFADSFD